MAVFIQKATKGVIFLYDHGENIYRKTNLETQFNNKPFDLKLLNNEGVDIVVSGNAFVSDIVFAESQKNDVLTSEFYKVESNYNSYVDKLDAIMENRYPRPRFISHSDEKQSLETINYHDPVNWSLTYKMRGFADLYANYCPKNHKLIDSVTAFSLDVILKAKKVQLSNILENDGQGKDEVEYEFEYTEEETDIDSDEEINLDLNDTPENDSKTGKYDDVDKQYYSTQVDAKWYSIIDDKNKDNSDNSYDNDCNYDDMSRIPEYLHVVKKPKGLEPHHIKAILDSDIDYSCIYLEHEPITPKHIEIKERHLALEIEKPSKILDLYDKGSEKPYSTIIKLSYASLSLTDYKVHSDEGCYYSAINYYNNNQGVVLTGTQNEPTMYYGNARYDGIFIPDVFYDPL